MALIFFHAVGTLLTLIALGQLGRGLLVFRSTFKRELRRRTEAAFH